MKKRRVDLHLSTHPNSLVDERARVTVVYYANDRYKINAFRKRLGIPTTSMGADAKENIMYTFNNALQYF